jgi:CheY-like chemotaxis protein/Tfp pilus assembly protein PilZ
MERKKILLSDNVELFMMLENTVFNRREFELITARCGQDILKLAKKEKPELIFMNQFMPDINGDLCCREIKGDDISAKIPVILVVPDTLKENAEKYKESGCNDILYKPIKRNVFLAVTRKYLCFLERVDDRFNARMKIKYCIMDQEIHYSYSVDMNSGGLFLETENPPMVNTPLDLEFQLPDSDSLIRCKARGAWINGPKERRKPKLPAGIGIEFLDISSQDKYAINEYIRNNGVFH